jgi:tetratricopeptide (TPR) repeat protein
MASRLEQLQQMLVQDPNDEFLQYAVAIEYFSVNNFKKAIDCFNAILNTNPNYLAAYYQAGKCYEELKQFDKAKDMYAKGIELAQKQNRAKTLNELKEALFLLEDE